MAAAERTTISVLVPTYRRPEDLQRCLVAMAEQTRRADQIVVVARRDDEPTRQALARLLASGHALDIVLVDKPGLVHALNSGLRAVAGDLMAMTDDDAAPHRDWLERIERTFRSDPRIAGAGGRDLIYGKEPPPGDWRSDVGRVQWFGRVVGNHHLGCGQPRRVDVLKGVNSAYRVEALKAIGFDERLKGAGAQFHFELVLGLSLIRNGWTLVYDPDILVDHYPAQRHDYNQRGMFNSLAVSNEVFNETLALLEHLPPLRRAAFMAWALLCGTRSYPGLFCAVVAAYERRRHVLARPRATLRGRSAAIAWWVRGRAAPAADSARPATDGGTASARGRDRSAEDVFAARPSARETP
jgi:glycosyltransferase involved in cell wall biosynthesis